MTSDPSFAIVTASRSDAILDTNLRRSQLLAHVPLHIERNTPSDSIACNRGMDATRAPFIIFNHHDVFLPHGWNDLLWTRIAELDAHDPK